MKYSSPTDYIGTLFEIGGDGRIEDVHLKIERRDAEKLADALWTRQVKRDNQDLIFSSVLISKAGQALFERGQYYWVKTDRGYSYHNGARRSVRFRGEFATFTRGADGADYALKAHIGSIEFDIREAKRSGYDETVNYEMVKAMLYPTGDYKMEPCESES